MGGMETVTSRDGTPIAYQRGGDGPPLVLVHGTTSDHSTWESVLPELQRLFTVYAMDRRGRGESRDGGSSAYDIEREFEDVVAVIDSIDGPTNGIHPSLYEVRSIGETWAEVKEGSQAPGMTVWAIEHYDWSVPGTVRWMIKESNLFAPGGSMSAQVDTGPGGSQIHVTWSRTGVGLKGRLLVGMIKLSGGKPVAASIKQGLDRILTSGDLNPEPPQTSPFIQARKEER